MLESIHDDVIKSPAATTKSSLVVESDAGGLIATTTNKAVPKWDSRLQAWVTVYYSRYSRLILGGLKKAV